MDIQIPRKIFIVDDDTALTLALQEYLTLKAAHNISIFATGEECLTRLSENPEVIVLAYHLNSVRKDAANGLEVLEAIKKLNPAIHVIMLSSQEHYGIAAQTIQKGAEYYVIKDETAFEEVSKIIEGI